MWNLLILTLILCIPDKYHTAVVTHKGKTQISVEAKVNDTHYIYPFVTLEEWEFLEIGDTIKINKKNLKIFKENE